MSNILKIKRLVQFVILMSLGLMGLNHICADKELQKNLYYIRYEQKDSIDVFFFGNSHASQGYLPMELWNQYGYTAYSMSIPEMPFPLVYYCALDAVKMQHPELFVVDLSAALFDYNDFSYMHRLVDNFTFTTRMKTIKEFVPANRRLEYLFPLYLYHNRWNEINYKDLVPYRIRYGLKPYGRKGAVPLTTVNESVRPERAIEMANSEEVVDISEDTIFWYEKLKDLCEKNNIELLFVVIPYEAVPVGNTEEKTIEDMKFYNATEKWCAQNGVGYLNLFRNIDEIDLDYTKDMTDISHLNVIGAKKVTDAVGDYISQNYNVTDNRSNPKIASKWEKDNEDYVQWINAMIAECEGTY